MAEKQRIEILAAREEHVKEITELARARSLDRTSATDAPRGGFLVSDYTEKTYTRRLTTAEHFYVAVRGGQLLGFVLAYSDERLEPDEWLNHRIKASLGEFLVIKQVCVARAAARQGVATHLYNHVLQRWSKSPVIAAVVAEPANNASSEFHRALGFEKLAELKPPDGRLRQVWVWRKPCEALLQTQYSAAVDLYKHEDNTNWQKLNNFFYITAALAAAVGFALNHASEDPGSTANRLTVIICVIGLATAVAFSQMLRWGYRYLSARKRAVIELEDYMAWHGGLRIVSRELSVHRRSGLRTSPTGLIMVMLPVLVGFCWAAVLLLSTVA